ncbi:MAG: hypothetical protein KatS3mg102_2645 [Planctomycetota bacterium]|nr:MAG: hypothetical protein KatS3mg102_2645 [Planctomycetota bacterium]
MRELRNVIERAIILGNGETLGLGDLPPEIRRAAGRAGTEVPAAARAPDASAPAAAPAAGLGAEPGGTALAAAGAAPAAAPDTAAAAGGFVLPEHGITWEELERSLVVQALQRTGGNQSRAARLLGLSRDQLRYRMQRFGLLPPAGRRPRAGR